MTIKKCSIYDRLQYNKILGDVFQILTHPKSSSKLTWIILKPQRSRRRRIRPSANAETQCQKNK